MTLHLSNAKARRVILHLQGLTIPPHLKLGQKALYELIVQMGFVQVDSIQWVERAHHMILFARNQTYRPKQLAVLLERERQLFEHWTHDASVIPTEFYPYWRFKFDRQASSLAEKFKNWQGSGFLPHCETLLGVIEDEGEIRSRDLVPENNVKRDMWQWHDGKAALEYLWRTGELCISGREGFQKKYDLTDRVLPGDICSRAVSHDEFVDWACHSAIERLGFGSPGDIARYWDLVSNAEAKDWSEDQRGDGLTSIVVDEFRRGRNPSDKSRELFARSDIKVISDTLPEPPARVRALSPFDPVIRDRNRLSWLFGYDYRIEIYVPEHKRQWGYYVFPLLEGDQLIGRIDMRAQRKSDQLEVKRLWLEPGVKLSAARLSALDSELVRQSRLAGVSNIHWLPAAEADRN